MACKQSSNGRRRKSQQNSGLSGSRNLGRATKQGNEALTKLMLGIVEKSKLHEDSKSGPGCAKSHATLEPSLNSYEEVETWQRLRKRKLHA
jgi:hypothetical protein